MLGLRACHSLHIALWSGIHANIHLIVLWGRVDFRSNEIDKDNDLGKIDLDLDLDLEVTDLEYDDKEADLELEDADRDSESIGCEPPRP